MNHGISRLFRMSLKYLFITSIIVLGLFVNGVNATENLRFSLHKIKSDNPGATLLVIGGIQGDEPGGFTAASMLVTNYTVTKGNLWVVPNLNFQSIIKRSRGVHGDMNRKFKFLSNNDPEFDEVQKIKQIILNKEVDVVVNLHDGSGFYTKKYISKLRNPNRWGQSIIIDQNKISDAKFGDLIGIAKKVKQHINSNISNKNKYFYVKNTETKKGDIEMEKSLTYFSITNNRPAFAVEASKQFRTHERTHYHLLAIEGFMKKLGIDFKRDFELTKKEVASLIGRNLKVSLYDNRINLDVAQARRHLNFVPMKKKSPLHYKINNPLIAVLENNKSIKVQYGNRNITSLKPQYFEYDNGLDSIKLQIDGEDKMANIGEKINIKENFRIMADSDYRVNVIGYAKRGVKNENGRLIRRKEIRSRFSIDKNENIFRVEFYKGKKFSGMILVSFENQQQLGFVSGNNRKISLVSHNKM